MSDYQDSQRIADRMKKSTRKLHELAAQVGSARQIKEFASDMRKSALAVEVVKALKAGESATAAEHIGRASEAYQQKLAVLAQQLATAETCIAEWVAEQASFEASRSLLSFSRESIKQL